MNEIENEAMIEERKNYNRYKKQRVTRYTYRLRLADSTPNLVIINSYSLYIPILILYSMYVFYVHGVQYRLQTTSYIDTLIQDGLAFSLYIVVII